ncbi:MAG: hypothetical protein JJU45_13425 [Acidimicrobiia bacterium]|nr:hypothetical protein [Acidimicrobiia bacterium]
MARWANVVVAASLPLTAATIHHWGRHADKTSVMQVLHRAHPLPAEQLAGGGRSLDEPKAWLLDAETFHAEFCTLFGALSGPDGAAPLRERATELWESPDPLVSDYVSRLPTDLPEEWAVSFSESHLAQWYRILMAAHLADAPAVSDPGQLRRGLPDLGWSTADARRAASGRQLRALASAYGHAECATAINLVLDPGLRGWLSPDDVADLRDRLVAVDRRRFRAHQDLVGVCEELWSLLDVAANGRGRVLLLLDHP